MKFGHNKIKEVEIIIPKKKKNNGITLFFAAS